MKLSLQQYRTLLVTYLKPQWPQAALLAVLLLSTRLQLYSPRLLAAFIDAAMAGAAWSDLIRLASPRKFGSARPGLSLGGAA